MARYDLGGGVVVDDDGVTLDGQLLLRPPFDFEQFPSRFQVVHGTDVRGELDCWSISGTGVSWRVQICAHPQGWVIVLNHDSLPWPRPEAIQVPWGYVQHGIGIQQGLWLWFR